MSKFKYLLIPFLLVFLVSCSKPGNRSFQGGSGQEKAITVLVQEIQKDNLEKYVRFTGKLEGITDVTMISETSGKTVEISKKLGDWIKAGESIGRIDNTDYANQFLQAEANHLAAEASYETADIQMRVSENLYTQNKISESEYLQTKSTLKSAEAAMKGASAVLASSRKALNNSKFTAPVSGYISEMNLEIGEYVANGSVIANIVDNSKLVIRTGIGESDIKYINNGDDVIIDHNDLLLPGVVTGKGIKPATGSNNFPVEIELDNPDRELLPGMVVAGRIHSETYRDIIYTSIENLREKYDEDYVFVISSENRAELRIVKLGEKIANNVIIVEGLEVGDKLVIDGIDSITEGSLVELKSGFKLN